VAPVDAHEGPVYVAAEDALYFTSLARVGHPIASIKRILFGGDGWQGDNVRVEVVTAETAGANGMVAAPNGGLYVCEQGSADKPARIAHLDSGTGELSTVVDNWRGLSFNSPNDVAVHGDGSIWFTDPSYGHLQGFRPPPELGDYVYRHDPHSGETTAVIDSFDKPNGLVFSADDSVLYVTDSGANQETGSYYVNRPHHVVAYDVIAGRHLGPARLFAVVTPGFPDGLKVDAAGYVYASSFSGVQVFNSAGDLIGEINLPGAVNFTFGGPDGNVLFITTDDALWAAVLEARGPHARGRVLPSAKRSLTNV
jgi:gluconolactonase